MQNEEYVVVSDTLRVTRDLDEPQEPDFAMIMSIPEIRQALVDGTEEYIDVATVRLMKDEYIDNSESWTVAFFPKAHRACITIGDGNWTDANSLDHFIERLNSGEDLRWND